MTPELALFLVLAAIAVLSALGMLLSPNAVHSALFLVMNFGVGAVFFLILGAPFIAMVQITVYAGAIMVLFLFVIMLLGAEQLQPQRPQMRWQAPLALVLAALFLTALWLLFARGAGGTVQAFAGDQAARDFGGPQAIGQILFSKYLLPFELTSFLLLVGMIGAVVLVRDEKRLQNPKSQIPNSKP